MVEVICDTDFVIHMATTRIKNLDNVQVEIGRLEFVVPRVVITELERLQKNDKKSIYMTAALDYIQKLKVIPLDGMYADPILIKHVKNNPCIIATLDRKLKKRIKEYGGTVLSLADDRIILE